jgi:2-polyprenyl-3-methyl-5-hydroxy-6-metoxy-1,4-benzoquinol methylase
VKGLDRLLQSWRIRKAERMIPHGARVLDVGCADGALFRQLDGRISGGVGIDPTLEEPVESERFRLVRGAFPDDLPAGERFDAITMLAVLEHIPLQRQPALAAATHRCLEPGGRLIVTVPSPAVDRILHVLESLRLIEGMALHEHYGFEPGQTPSVFTPHGLGLAHARKFQLGLNNLFVFEKG